MSQMEVLKLLKKTNKPLLSQEIGKKLGIGKSAIANNLRKLYEQGEVKRKLVKIKHYRTYEWKCK